MKFVYNPQWRESKLFCHRCDARASVKYIDPQGRPTCNVCALELNRPPDKDDVIEERARILDTPNGRYISIKDLRLYLLKMAAGYQLEKERSTSTTVPSTAEYTGAIRLIKVLDDLLAGADK